MFFAQLVTASAHLLHRGELTDITQFMRHFLDTADYHEIRQHEIKNGYIWSTLFPFVRLAYFPTSNATRMCMRSAAACKKDVMELRELEQLCVEAGIFGLQNTLSGELARGILVQEGLLEYVTCLPWCVSTGTEAHAKARELVLNLGQKVQLQPPQLQTIVRARLAAWHFGLDKVYHTISIHELLSELC